MTRLIRHIPDEHFKTIRYYGIYSRRTKSLSKKLMDAWQQTSRKWIVKVQRVLKRRNWRERIKQTTGKDPLVCPKCECYYEYKGEVCLEEGRLRVKYARCQTTKACLERMICHLTGVEKTKTKREEKEKPHSLRRNVS